MMDIMPNQEQKDYAAKQVESYNFGQRGVFDGNKEQQFVGVLGQTVVADLLQVPRPDGTSGNDKGVDFVMNHKNVDIKTMTRTVSVKEHYVHNFVAYQKKYPTDVYIFASYNKKNNVFSICGSVSKEQLQERAEFFEKGQLRYRDDGTAFPAKAPLYEIKQSDLNRINSVEDIKNL
jgi:hypothetical protein